MGEFVTIQVGQCGNQIGSAFWPLILQEYNVKNVPGGIERKSVIPNQKSKLDNSFFSFFSTKYKNDIDFSTIKFSDLKKFKIKARAILIDMEDSVVNRFHTGALRNLFDHSCTVKNYPGSGNNWAEGFYTHGVHYQKEIENTIRKAVEKCSNLLGFLMMYSVGGGTGSGLGSFVLNLLEKHYPNVDRFVTCVYPNGSEDVITGPYNTVLATKYLSNYATCVFPVENRALLSIVNEQKNQKGCIDTVNHVVKCKPFQDMNSIIVNMLLHLTSGSRFSGGLNMDMNEVYTNMVPFPNMNFICSSVNPLTVSVDRFGLNIISSKFRKIIFMGCCHKKNQLLKLDPFGINSTLLGVSLIGRGGFTISEMRNYVDYIQDRGHFTPWSQQAIKIGLCGIPPVGHSSSMLGLFNSSSIISLLDDILQQFNKLYIKKAHVHHYTKIDGFDIDLFEDCKENILQNMDNYESITTMKNVYKPRFEVL